jgi:hypothetical protein
MKLKSNVVVKHLQIYDVLKYKQKLSIGLQQFMNFPQMN